MTTANHSADREIITTRVLNFPQELVFRAWTEPAHLAKWWGPKGFTNTFHEYDLKPGGKWRFVMHGPDKGNYNNECVFLEIDPPRHLLWDRISKPHFKVAVSFNKVSEQTTEVRFRMIFNAKEECDKLRPFVVDKNEENFDRLEIELATMDS